jgi:hypothetical protein
MSYSTRLADVLREVTAKQAKPKRAPTKKPAVNTALKPGPIGSNDIIKLMDIAFTKSGMPVPKDRVTVTRNATSKTHSVKVIPNIKFLTYKNLLRLRAYMTHHFVLRGDLKMKPNVISGRPVIAFEFIVMEVKLRGKSQL